MRKPRRKTRKSRTSRAFRVVLAVVLVGAATALIIRQVRQTAGALPPDDPAIAGTSEGALALMYSSIAAPLQRCTWAGDVQPRRFAAEKRGAAWLVTLQYDKGGVAKRAQWLVDAGNQARPYDAGARWIDTGCSSSTR